MSHGPIPYSSTYLRIAVSRSRTTIPIWRVSLKEGPRIRQHSSIRRRRTWPVPGTGRVLLRLWAAALELTFVVGLVELALRLGDEPVLAERPLLEAGEADACSGPV